MRYHVSESTFRQAIAQALEHAPACDYVTGPGRSGAVAAVYASHLLGLPFVPYRQHAPGRALIVDTATLSGRTLRKASRVYGGAPAIVAYREPPGVRLVFWYESEYDPAPELSLENAAHRGPGGADV